MAARRRAQTLALMRTLARSGASPRAGVVAGVPMAGPQERCDICGTTVPEDHRHLLHLEERRIVCSCEACWALHSGDPEYRPSGMRTVWLEGFDCSEEMWGRFQIPIGLAFLMRSSVSAGVVAFYPSPAGATESELSMDAWETLVQANPAARGARSRCRSADRQPPLRPTAVCDRADRRVLRPRRTDQVAVGGDLGWRRARASRAPILRRAADTGDERAVRGNREVSVSVEQGKLQCGDSRARVRNCQGRAHGVRGSADDGLRGDRERAERASRCSRSRCRRR